jgi:prepilin-type N-terminal cleavage/methylation domain-containing protein
MSEGIALPGLAFLRKLFLRKFGMTLTEIMVVTVIFTFMMAGLYVTLSAGRISWQTHEAAVKTQREMRNCVTQMSRDFRVAKNLVVNEGADGLTASFFIPDQGNIKYFWSKTGAEANRISRFSTSASRIIANDIIAFSLYETPEEITIRLVAKAPAIQGHPSTFQLEKKVAKR